VSEPHISFEQEGAILAAFSDVYPGPVACTACGRRITAETGWKPRLAFVCAAQGVRRFVVDLYCGSCLANVGDTPRLVCETCAGESPE